MSVWYVIPIQITIFAISLIIFRRKLGLRRETMLFVLTCGVLLVDWLGLADAWRDYDGVSVVILVIIIVAMALFQFILFLLSLIFVQGIDPPPHPRRY